MFMAASHRLGTSHAKAVRMEGQWSGEFLQEQSARKKVRQPSPHSQRSICAGRASARVSKQMESVMRKGWITVVIT